MENQEEIKENQDSKEEKKTDEHDEVKGEVEEREVKKEKEIMEEETVESAEEEAKEESADENPEEIESEKKEQEEIKPEEKESEKEEQYKKEPDKKEKLISEVETRGGFKIEKEHYLKLEDVVEEEEYSKEEREVLTRLYDDTISEFKEGEIVKGKILAIDDKEIVVDIGFKSEGTIPIEEFDESDEMHIGDEIEVYLDNIEDKDGQMILSKKKADFTRTWQKIMDMYEKDTVFKGKCLRRIKGGMVVDLLGIDAFLPGSQIDVKPIRDFDALINQTMDFKIVKVNELRKNIVVSRRVIIEEGLKEQRGKILDELEKGQVREGVVKNITDFGVFIDLGGVDGLLHITDLSWGRVNHPSEVVKFDQKLKVMILDFDENKERISLGLKQLQPHPWDDIEKKYPIGSKVKGKVVSLTDYGAFVEIEKGIEGLIHISEMSWTEHIKHPSKVLSLGDNVESTILSIEKEEKKISLGLKQNEPDPWDLVSEKYPVKSIHSGIVRNITNFGVFVELEEGIDGLVHISDLSWTKKIRHPGEIVKKGDKIDVIVMDISKEERKISLGHKQIEENPWDKFEKEYNVGSFTEAEIVRIMDKGLIVNLPLKVEGFVPTSQIDLRGKKLQDTFKPGEKVNLKIIEFEKSSKKIVLSHTGFIKDKEKTEVKEFLAKQQKAAETLGEQKEIKEKIEKLAETEKKETDKKTEVKASEKKEEKKAKEEKPEEIEEEKKEKPEKEKEPVKEEKKVEKEKDAGKKETKKKTVKKEKTEKEEKKKTKKADTEEKKKSVKTPKKKEDKPEKEEEK